MEMLMPNQMFVGLIQENKKIKDAYILKMQSISLIKANCLLLIAKVTNRMKIEHLTNVDLNEEQENANVNHLYVNYVSGYVKEEKVAMELNESDMRKLESIEKQMSFFLSQIRKTNPLISEQLVHKYAIDAFRARLTVDWREDANLFVRSIGSMLILPYNQKKILCSGVNIQNKIDIIYEFLKNAGPHNDPIFFIDYGLKHTSKINWSQIGFICAILFLALSLIFPNLKL